MKINKQVEMYDFTLDEIRSFNNTSGIYALIYDNEVIYVGQSKNIGDRLRTHRRTRVEQIVSKIIKEGGKMNRSKQVALYDFITNNKEDIQFIVLLETKELDRYEEHYIKLFQPKYNYKGVDVPF